MFIVFIIIFFIWFIVTIFGIAIFDRSVIRVRFECKNYYFYHHFLVIILK